MTSRSAMLAVAVFGVTTGCANPEPIARPADGYRSLVAVQTFEIPTGSATYTLAAGTRLVADSTINGQPVFCGSMTAYVDVQRRCVVMREDGCFSVFGWRQTTCPAPGAMREERL